MDDKVEEKGWWGCDTEGGGSGGPDEGDESLTDPVRVPRRPKVPDEFMVGV